LLKRFVEQEHRRFTNDRAPDCDALLLPARQVFGLSVEQLGQPHRGGDRFGARQRLGAIDANRPQRKRKVLANGQVRVQRIVLKHHRDVAVFGLEFGHVLVANANRPRGHGLESRDHAQGRGLATPGRPDENRERPVREFQIETLDDGVVAVLFDDVVERYACHVPVPVLIP
jgi:hypothetical protein